MTTPRPHSQASCVLVFVGGSIFRIISYILEIRLLLHGLRFNIYMQNLYLFFCFFYVLRQSCEPLMECAILLSIL